MGTEPLRLHGTLEIAIWVSDDDDPAKIKGWRNGYVPAALRESAEAHGFTIGPVRYSELKPGEGRAGTPPKGIQGTNVRLLVAEADAVGFKAMPPPVFSFLADLTFKDLQLLRKVTRRAVLPKLLTDPECDEMIERLGPVAAERVLKDVVDRKAANDG